MTIDVAALEGLVLLRPAWLLALLPLVVFAWWSGRRATIADGPWRAVVAPRLRRHVLGRAVQAGRIWQLVAAALMVLALAGPTRETSGSDIAWRGDAARVLLVDLSPGPVASDDGIAQLEDLRTVLLELLAQMPGGETALVVYAETAFTAVPFSTDPEYLRRYVPELSPKIMPTAGDDPAAALAYAAELLRRNGSTRRAVVWVTPGRTTPTDFQAVLLDGIDLHVVSLGSAPAVQQFAAAAGARVLAYEPTGKGLDALRNALAGDSWRPNPAPSRVVVRDFGPYLLLALVPVAAMAVRGTSLLALAVPLLSGGLLFAHPAPVQAFSVDEGLAYGHFVLGNYDRAAEGFVDPRWRAAAFYRAGRYPESVDALAGLSDAGDHYNRGNALARAGQLQQALAAFEASLALNPEDGDARYNRDLVRAMLQSRAAGQSGSRGGEGGQPPPATDRPSGRESDSSQREAEILAEQWLRRAGDDPAGLLERKLRLEQRRRDAEAARAQQ